MTMRKMKRTKRSGNLSWSWPCFPTMVASTEFGYSLPRGLFIILCSIPLSQCLTVSLLLPLPLSLSPSTHPPCQTYSLYELINR